MKSVRTAQYRKLLEALPNHIRELADDAFKRFEKDPFHPSLENEDLYDSKKGRHRKGSRSVAISRRYRAIYVVDNGPDGADPTQVCWYWCGSHESYNIFTGRK